MARLSAAERRAIVENLSVWLERMVGDERNDVEVNLEAGMQRTVGDDLESSIVRPDGNSTLIVRIRGAAGASPVGEPGRGG